MLNRKALSRALFVVLSCAIISGCGGSNTGKPPLEVFHPGSQPINYTRWATTLGGAGDDTAKAVIPTSDGGCIVAGGTYSSGAGDSDGWIFRLDINGRIQWQKTYGGTGEDWFRGMAEIPGGGYVAVGATASGSNGGLDFWIVKIDSSGNKIWEKKYGGSMKDWAADVDITPSGGIAVAGHTATYGNGNGDFWVMLLNSNGEKVWDRTAGGYDWDGANAVLATSDGGILAGGFTFSFSTGGSYNGDFWMVKLSSTGDGQWMQNYGNRYDEAILDLFAATDGGYIAAGYKTVDNLPDFWVLKTNSEGTQQWDFSFGATNYDIAYSVIQTSDGGLAVAGYSSSYSSGMGSDFLILKYSPDILYEWGHVYGGSEGDFAYSIKQSADGGFFVVGDTGTANGDTDAWILRTDFLGRIDDRDSI